MVVGAWTGRARGRESLFGDHGSISAPLAERLFLTQGLRLITKLRKSMRNQLLHLSDQLLLRKRALIETIVDQLHSKGGGSYGIASPLPLKSICK